MNGHAFLSPSKYAQWSVCAGARSLEESDGVTQRASRYAAYGTQAHALAEAILKGEGTAALPQDAEMVSGVSTYVELVRARQKRHEDAGAIVSCFVEMRLPVSTVTTEEGAHGTADVILVASYGNRNELEVIDLKFGVGEKVDVLNNGQLQVYGAAAMEYFGDVDFDTVTLIISQPRLAVEASIWQLSASQLREFASAARVAAKRALGLRGSKELALKSLSATEKACRWCSFKTKCPAYARMQDANKLEGFDGV